MFSKLRHHWPILLILLLSIPKLFSLTRGYLPAEPDERIYVEIIRNFTKSPYPEFDGIPFYYGLPLYPILGYLINFIFEQSEKTNLFIFDNPLFSLRLVSVLMSIFLTLTIYFYIKHKLNKTAALMASLFFLLCPLAIFYSRASLIEMTVTAFSFAFIASFDAAVDSRKKLWAVISGLFLGLALFSKYTALIFVIVPIFYLGCKIIQDNIRGDRPKEWLESISDLSRLRLDIIPLITLFLGFLIPLPSFIFLYRHDSWEFKTQLRQSLTGISHLSPQGFRFYLQEYLSKFPYWLSWSILTLAILGLAIALLKYRKRFVFVLASLFLILISISLREPQPRYFFIIVPFMVAFAGIGLFELMKMTVNITKVKFTKQGFRISIFLITIYSLVTLIFLLPKSYEAYQATKHDLLTEVGNFIHEQDPETKYWVATTYWPTMLVEQTKNFKTTWLATNFWESQAFSNWENSPFKQIDKPSLEKIQTEGGFAIIEDLYSSLLLQYPPRVEAKEIVEQQYQPFKTFIDNQSNFPYFKEKENRIRVYFIESEKK